MSDRLLGVACVALAAGMAWAAQDYAAAFAYEPVGPRAFPQLLAALLAAAGLWLLVKPSAVQSYRELPYKPLLLCVVATALYALTFEWLGFPLATALMCVPVGMAFGGSLRQCLLAGVVLGLGGFLVFDRLLDVVLPAGWLASWLQGLGGK